MMSSLKGRSISKFTRYSLLYGYGSIPINPIFSGMNIHLPAILMFTRVTRFWHTAIWLYDPGFEFDDVLFLSLKVLSCFPLKFIQKLELTLANPSTCRKKGPQTIGKLVYSLLSRVTSIITVVLVNCSNSLYYIYCSIQFNTIIIDIDIISDSWLLNIANYNGNYIFLITWL